jgi:pyridinium-3,5-bisthiocarboxylic acid mononucleotide nickel chelatase
MTRIAYFDLANGISGDMALGALAHAGRRSGMDAERAITDAVASIPLPCNVTFVDDERRGLACVRAEVKTDGAKHQPAALRDAIERAAMSPAARVRALVALDALVGAEARVHGSAPEDVHLHELASADTAADLVGAAVALEALAIDTVVSAPVPVPSGWITGEHGAIPLPAPVVLELLRGATLRGVDATSELVTPSGAAILVAHDARFDLLPEMTLEAVGIGGGTRDGERPNVCRVLVGEAKATPSGARLETCVLLEANIDDQTPESLGYALETLMAAGALDAWVTPVVMKKSRPAFAVSVLVRLVDEERIANEIFRHTTTIGLRRRTTVRRVLDREIVVVSVRGHDIRVKIARLSGDVVNVAPEFDDCAAASRASGILLSDVYDEARVAASRVI